MASVEPHGAGHVLRTPSDLTENELLSGNRRLARRRTDEVISGSLPTQRQRSLQGGKSKASPMQPTAYPITGLRKNISASDKSGKRCFVSDGPRFKIVKRRSK